MTLTVSQTTTCTSLRAKSGERESLDASIQLTVDTYGKWPPMGNKAAVNGLDEERGSKLVAKMRTVGRQGLEPWTR